MDNEARPTYEEFTALANRVKSLELALALTPHSKVTVDEPTVHPPNVSGKIRGCMLCKKDLSDNEPYSRVRSYKETEGIVYNSFICTHCLETVEYRVFENRGYITDDMEMFE